MSWKAIEAARSKLAREEGAVVKDWGGRLPIALAYANSYYVGMSSLGFQTIYSFLNRHPQVVCERIFFNPDDAPIGLESQRPLMDFAVLAFSLSFELDYWNALQVMKMGGLPLFAAERDEQYPLVIAGGAAVTGNPEPMAPFVDAFVAGEAEPVLPELLNSLTATASVPRREQLESLAAIPGLYVPLLRPEDGPALPPVKRLRARNLGSFATVSTILTPNTELGDMYLIEATRGCARGCRFCMAGYIFRPFRVRSLEDLLAQAQPAIEARRRVGLVGAAVSDHPQLQALVEALVEKGAELSLSSLRIDAMTPVIGAALAKSGVRTITLAPEAGSERLRQVIGKAASDDQILEAADIVGRHRFSHLKLYFMIGLPSEGDEDISGLIDLARAIKGRLDQAGGGTRLTVNICPFVPKAHTPFQWLPMAPVEELEEKQARVRRALRPLGIAVSEESPRWCTIQGALSRGDRNLGAAMALVERNTLSGWNRAVKMVGLDLGSYAHRAWHPGQPVPWDVIDAGTRREHLRLELAKSMGDVGPSRTSAKASPG